MATITAIQTQKRHPDRVNIDLNGEYAFSLAGNLAAGLQVGQELEHQRIELLQARDADEIAYQRALGLLRLRERSEFELRNHLRRHKTAEEVIERALARLREHRHADDTRFAQQWVENRSTFRPRGRTALAWELRHKGVAPDTVNAALSDLDESALAYQAGLKKARQLAPADWQVFRAKISAYLARRGFPTAIIASTISRLWTEIHREQPSLQEKETP